jgi:hypothetical protein
MSAPGNERIDMLKELIRSNLTRQGERCLAESETSEIKQEIRNIILRFQHTLPWKHQAGAGDGSSEERR